MEANSIRDLVDKYEQELVRLNFKNSTITRYREFWRQLILYLDSTAGGTAFCKGTGFQFLHERYGIDDDTPSRDLTRHEQHMRQMVRKLLHFHSTGNVGRPSRVPQRSIQTEEFAHILRGYAEFCVRHGYAVGTRRNLRHHAIRFFMFVESHNVAEISEVCGQTIVDFVNSCPVLSYRSIGLSLTCLRNLLGFLHTEGLHSKDFTSMVPRQQSRTGSSVPSVWNHEDVVRLVNAIDRGNPCGKRDFAIILLVTRLGIRAGDVRKLKLEDLGWDSNRIEFVQSKTGKNLSLPLLKDVGWAIIDYLEQGRPKSDSPFVFLSHLAPYQPLGENNCFRHIISRCRKIAGISESYRQKLGTHSLRHTLASTLLENNTPLPIIAGVMGHTSSELTATYLKTSDARLRECAIDLPGGAQ